MEPSSLHLINSGQTNQIIYVYMDKQRPEPNYRNIHPEIKSPLEKLSKFRQKID